MGFGACFCGRAPRRGKRPPSPLAPTTPGYLRFVMIHHALLHRSGSTSDMPTSDRSSPREVDGGMWKVVSTGVNSAVEPASSLRWSVDREDADVPIVLHSLAGRGSYGKVYKATWGKTLVAVKVIPHDARVGDESMHEIKIVMSLDHPCIVRGLSYVTWERQPDSEHSIRDTGTAAQSWLIQDYCDGGTLSRFIRHGYLHDRRTHMGIIVDMLLDIASAMHYMHGRHILHGDLKCSNVLLCTNQARSRLQRYAAKLADFGLSRVLAPHQLHINTSTLGTMSHMSPEMLRSGRMGYKADVYAFGMVMYEMLTGYRPFSGMMHGNIIERVLVQKKMPEIPADMPPLYVDVMRRCWSYEADARPSFADVLELLCDLRAEAVEWDERSAKESGLYVSSESNASVSPALTTSRSLSRSLSQLLSPLLPPLLPPRNAGQLTPARTLGQL